MTIATLRMRNGCIKIDDNNFIIPGLMKISSEEGITNGMYLQANSGTLMDENGYSTINIINTDPNGVAIGVVVQNIEFTPPFSILSGETCFNDSLLKSSMIYNEFCGSSKGSVIAGLTCDVIIYSNNEDPIIEYLPSFREYHDKTTDSRQIVLWNSVDKKIIDFTEFPLDSEVIHSQTLQDQGIYRISYDDNNTEIREIFYTDLSNPRNLANEVNDMFNAIQSNPQTGCDLLPSHLF